MAKITISRVSFVGKAPVINLTPSFVLRLAEAHIRTQEAKMMYNDLGSRCPVDGFARCVENVCKLVEDIYSAIAKLDEDEKPEDKTA